MGEADRNEDWGVNIPGSCWGVGGRLPRAEGRVPVVRGLKETGGGLEGLYVRRGLERRFRADTQDFTNEARVRFCFHALARIFTDDQQIR